MKSPPTLVLASTSVYRRQLLERLQIPFLCDPPGVDETALPDEPPPGLVARLARSKARAVAARHPEAWIVGSDQVAVLRDGADPPLVLGKPGTAARCIEQIRRCSGHTLEYLTAVAVLRHDVLPGHEFTDVTRVTYRRLDAATIERYVARESPLDCAGGFKSEALGIALCDAIETVDPTALVGLPLIRLCGVLREVGFTLP